MESNYNSLFPQVNYEKVLYVDSGQNKATEGVAYGCVVDDTGNNMLGAYSYLFTNLETKVVELPVGVRRVLISDFTDVKIQNNNGAELLAMYAGLVIALTDNYTMINSDSQLIVDH